ncbi:MAG: hypothetical protein U1E65_03460 [Myxococcota bacterium]
MDCKLLRVPKTIDAGDTFTCIVSVTDGTPGQTCHVAVWRTMPTPELDLGDDAQTLDAEGGQTFAFKIRLNKVGINVVHAEAQTESAFASSSKGLTVE